jgi:hypothetical protein
VAEQNQRIRPHQRRISDLLRRLERQRDESSAQQPGKPWSVEKWLKHWVENIAKPAVSENMYDGYEVAVRVHLVPGIATSGEAVPPDVSERAAQGRQGSPGAPHCPDGSW